MATNGGSINYTVKYNVDKTGLNQMKASLQEILNLTQGDLIKINSKATKEDLKQLQDAAKAVGSALERAFNPNLGTLNVSKFNQELKKLNVDKLYKDFNIAGQAGRNAFRNITSDILTTNMQLKQTHTLLDNMATTMANTIKWGVASSVMNTFTGSVQQAYGYVKNLDSSLNDIRIVTNKSADEMAKFAVQANKAAKELGASTTSYTDASLIYYQQGLTDAEVAARAEVTLKAANVTGQSADAVSEQLTAVWNGYKVSAEEAELYIDKLAAVAATTASDLEELSVGMSKVASAASVMGVDVDQLNAQLATIVSVTRQAPESVGTALKTIYARMGDIEAGLDGETSLSNYTEQMAQMGYDVLDANGKLRDMGQVIEEIGNNWKNMSREQQISLSQTVAGTRQYNNLLALFDNWDMYTKAIETSGNAAGTLQEQQDIYMDRTVAHLQQLRTATEDLYDSLFETKSFNNLLDGITGAVDLLGNFADAIGGGGNALLLLGTIGTQVFSKQIAAGLATTIMNFQKVKENTAQLNAEMEILNQFDNANIDDTRTQKLIEMKRQQLELTKSLTIEERNISNEYIKQQNELYKEQDAIENNLKLAEQYYSKLTGEDLQLTSSTDKTTGKVTITNQEEISRQLKTTGEGFVTEAEKLKDVSSIFEQMTAAAANYRKEMELGRGKVAEAQEEAMNVWTKNKDVIIENIQAARRLANSDKVTANNKQELIKLLEEWNRLTKDGTDVDLTNVRVAELAQKIQKTRLQTLKAQGKEYINTANAIDASSKALENNNSKIQILTQNWNNFIRTIDLRNNIQQFTTLVGKVGQVASGIRTLSQVTEIWNNQDLTTGEKILQLTTSITMGFPMLISGVMGVITTYKALTDSIRDYIAVASIKKAFDKTDLDLTTIRTTKEALLAVFKKAGVELTEEETESLTVNTAAKILNAKVEEGSIAPKTADTVATELNTIANHHNTASILKLIAAKTLLNPTFWLITGAVTAVTGAIWLSVKAYNAEQDAALKANEKVQALTDSYNKLKQSYDAFNQNLNKYDEAIKGLQDLTDNVEEYQKAINKANDAVLELIQNNKDLIVTRNEKGLLEIDPTSRQSIQEQQNSQIRHNQNELLLAQIDANKKNSNYDKTLLKRELGFGVLEEDIDNLIDILRNNNYTLTMQDIETVEGLQYVSEELKQSILDNTPELIKLAKSTNALEQTNKALTEQISGNILNEDSSEGYQKLSSQEQLAYQQIIGTLTSDINNTQEFRNEKNNLSWNASADDLRSEYAKLFNYNLSQAKINTFTGKTTFKNSNGEVLKEVTLKEMRDYLAQTSAYNNIINNNDVSILQLLSNLKSASSKYSNQNISSDKLYNALLSGADGTFNLDNISQAQSEYLLANLNSLKTQFNFITDEDAKQMAFEDANAYWTSLEDTLKTRSEQSDLDVFGSGVSGVSKSVKALQDKYLSGEITSENIVNDTDYQKIEQNLDKLVNLYPELNAAANEFKNTSLVGMQSWSEAFGQLKDALDKVELEFLSKNLDKAVKDFNINMDVNSEEFDQKMDAILSADYAINVEIHSQAEEAFEGLEGAIDNIQEQAGKIGDNFIVAADDIRELNNAFPGILTGLTDLHNGTVKLSEESVKSAMAAAQAEVAADAEATNTKLKNAANELRTKQKVYQGMANAAFALAETNGKIDENTKWHKLTIQEGLNQLNTDSANLELDNAETVATNSNENAAIMAKNWGNAYYSAAKDAAAFADAAVQAAKVAAEGKGSVTLGDFGVNYQGSSGVSSEATQLSAFQDKYNTASTSDDWNELGQAFQNAADQLGASANDIEGMMVEAGAKLGDAVKDFSNISKGLGSDGAKSNKDKMDLLKDQVDIYHDINMEIKSLSKEMDKLGKQEKKLFGQQLIDNLNEQLGILQAQTAAYKEKIKLAQKEASMYRGNLASQGINFDAQGNVTNYIAAMKGKQDYLNGLISKYNSMSETEQKNFKSTVEQAKKDYEQFQKDMEHYENLVSETIPDLEAQIQDAMDKQIEIQIQKFTMEVEIRLEMAEAERDWNEFKKKIIDDIDDDDILGNAMAKMLDFDSYYKDSGKGAVQALTKQVNGTLDQLHQIDETGTSSVYGDNKAQAMEDLQKYYTELMQQLEDVKDLQDEIKDAYLDMIDEANEKFDAQIKKYETITELIEHNMNVVELLNGDDAYDQLAKYYELQERNNLKQLDFHRQEVAFWRERMDSVEEGSEEWDAYRENWQEAVNELNESVSASIENLIAKYQNTVSGIFEDLNDKVTGGKGLDYVKEEWDLINKNADQYLDTINSAFAIRELEGKYLDALDNTDSISAQRQLNDMMNEQLNMLRAKDKLTQYDVDRANALYEIELKKIALQEAQQNKSQMRLIRDAQGNYSYQYVADQDAIGNAEDELASAQNSLYNMDKEQYRTNLDEIYEMYVEFQDKLNELYMNNTLSDIEREEQKKLLVEQYGELINGLVEQNEDIRLNLQESALQAYADFQGELLMEDIVPQWDSSVQEMADKFAGEGGFIPTCQDSLIELDEATADYEDSLEDLEDTAGISFDEIEDGLDKNIDLTYDFIDANDELIDKYGEQLNAIEDVWHEVQVLTQKYEEAEKAAIRATEAAYKYWQTAKDMAASGIDGGPSYSGGLDTSDYNGAGPNDNSPSKGGSPSDEDKNPKSTGSGKKWGVVPNRGGGALYYPGTGPAPDLNGNLYSSKSNANAALSAILSNSELRGRFVEGLKVKQFKTGGYTGSWGSDGRLAVLHQKELVLNSKDTENVLSAVNVVRSMSGILQSLKDSMTNRISGFVNRISGGNDFDNNAMTIEQTVHIDARFEGQTESSQIETALINLVNYASQHAYDTTR